MSVPAPVFVNPPGPVSAPVSVRIVDGSTLNALPPADASVTERVIEKLAVFSSAPPASVSEPAAAPSEASCAMASVPPVIVQGVSAVVTPVSVQVEASRLLKRPKPWNCCVV